MGVLGAGIFCDSNASLLGRNSSGPPSKERDTCIFVSFVIRLIRAVRRGGDSAMLKAMDLVSTFEKVAAIS